MAPASSPGCGRVLLLFAARFLVRQTRPVFRLGHPVDPVCWFTLCELSAQRGSRAKLHLTCHLRPLPEVCVQACYGRCFSRNYCPHGHCPKGHIRKCNQDCAGSARDGDARCHRSKIMYYFQCLGRYFLPDLSDCTRRSNGEHSVGIGEGLEVKFRGPCQTILLWRKSIAGDLPEVSLIHINGALGERDVLTIGEVVERFFMRVSKTAALTVVLTGRWAAVVARLCRVAHPSGGLQTHALAAALLLAMVGPGMADLAVTDGDTFRLDRTIYRLGGIDAPEIDQTCLNQAGEVWPCGVAARDRLTAHIGNRAVRCKDEGPDPDHKHRRIGICSIEGETATLNEWLVREGWAIRFGSSATGPLRAGGIRRTQGAARAVERMSRGTA